VQHSILSGRDLLQRGWVDCFLPGTCVLLSAVLQHACRCHLGKLYDRGIGALVLVLYLLQVAVLVGKQITVGCGHYTQQCRRQQVPLLVHYIWHTMVALDGDVTISVCKSFCWRNYAA